MIETDLAITLQMQEWNILLEALADGRWRIVNPLIVKIAQQMQHHQQAAQQGLQQGFQQPQGSNVQPMPLKQ